MKTRGFITRLTPPQFQRKIRVLFKTYSRTRLRLKFYLILCFSENWNGVDIYQTVPV